MSSHMGPTYPRETTSKYYMMLHSGLFPPLTTKFVTQSLDTINKYRKGINRSLMGVQEHTLIIYMRISFEVTNTPTLSLEEFWGLKWAS